MTERTVESVAIRRLTGRKITASYTLLPGLIFNVTLPEQLTAGVYLITVKGGDRVRKPPEGW